MAMSTDLNSKSQIKNSSVDRSLSQLNDIRENSGASDTTGILDSEITTFLSLDEKLSKAIDEAHSYHLKLRKDMGTSLLMKRDFRVRISSKIFPLIIIVSIASFTTTG